MSRKKLNQFEKELLAEALYWRAKWDDACPDAGTGPSLKELCEKLTRSMGLRYSEEELEDIIEVGGQLGKFRRSDAGGWRSY